MCAYSYMHSYTTLHAVRCFALVQVNNACADPKPHEPCIILQPVKHRVSQSAGMQQNSGMRCRWVDMGVGARMGADRISRRLTIVSGQGYTEIFQVGAHAKFARAAHVKCLCKTFSSCMIARTNTIVGIWLSHSIIILTPSISKF